MGEEEQEATGEEDIEYEQMEERKQNKDKKNMPDCNGLIRFRYVANVLIMLNNFLH